jgi:uncharacterized membrane protein YphA (DoxX/SURF4 family)
MRKMDRISRNGNAIHIASVGHALFAATMVGLGIFGLIKSDFTVVWQGVPKSVPAREVLIYFTALISLASGIGLFWRRAAALAAAALLASFILWFLLWRVRALFIASLIESTWSCGQTMVMMAASWVLFAWFSKNWTRFGFATGDKGVRIARLLYGLGLIPFGYAHFANLKGTVSLVPSWLPWHAFWAYFTGATFMAAGVAIVAGVFARLAAALSVLQMAMFAVLVWLPIVMRGSLNTFQWGEVVMTLALTAAGWVVADSYSNTPWLASRASDTDYDR